MDSIDGTTRCLTNERTGFGQHGDYVFGWEGDTLQTAMDSACYLRNCSQLIEQAPAVKNKCSVPVTVEADQEIDACEFIYYYFRAKPMGANARTGLDELPGGGSGI